jgi:hypothetical protein
MHLKSIDKHKEISLIMAASAHGEGRPTSGKLLLSSRGACRMFEPPANTSLLPMAITQLSGFVGPARWPAVGGVCV